MKSEFAKADSLFFCARDQGVSRDARTERFELLTLPEPSLDASPRFVETPCINNVDTRLRTPEQRASHRRRKCAAISPDSPAFLVARGSSSTPERECWSQHLRNTTPVLV